MFFLVLFVRALDRHPATIRSGAFSYGLFTAITAFGLWRERGWGRSVALIIALGTSALGVLQILSSVVTHRGPLVGAIVLFVVSTGLTFLLSLPVFNPPASDDDI